MSRSGAFVTQPNSYNTNFSDAINGHSLRPQDPLGWQNKWDGNLPWVQQVGENGRSPTEKVLV
jgi:hypothetical protein